jgi:stress-induced morphogen
LARRQAVDARLSDREWNTGELPDVIGPVRPDRDHRRDCVRNSVPADERVLALRRGEVERRGYDAAMAPEPLEALLQQAFPDAEELSVVDRTGGGDHFQVTIASSRFAGLPLVEQHRLVYDALAEPLADGSIHELRIKTKGTAE